MLDLTNSLVSASANPCFHVHAHLVETFPEEWKLVSTFFFPCCLRYFFFVLVTSWIMTVIPILEHYLTACTSDQTKTLPPFVRWLDLTVWMTNPNIAITCSLIRAPSLSNGQQMTTLPTATTSSTCTPTSWCSTTSGSTCSITSVPHTNWKIPLVEERGYISHNNRTNVCTDGRRKQRLL